MAKRLVEILGGLFGRSSIEDDEPSPIVGKARRCPACDSMLYDEKGRSGIVRCLGCDALWRWSGSRGTWERVKR